MTLTLFWKSFDPSKEHIRGCATGDHETLREVYQKCVEPIRDILDVLTLHSFDLHSGVCQLDGRNGFDSWFKPLSKSESRP